MAVKNPYKLFIDSGAFIAIMNKKDPFHQEARLFYTSLKRNTNVLTSLLVVSETYTWLRYHANYHLAACFLDIINKAEKAEFLKIILPTEDLINKTHAVLKNYNDQDLSYTDATSFVILETMNIQDVFGFDSHFYIISKNLWPITKK